MVSTRSIRMPDELLADFFFRRVRRGRLSRERLSLSLLVDFMAGDVSRGPPLRINHWSRNHFNTVTDAKPARARAARARRGSLR
jgi:hypothetical protein